MLRWAVIFFVVALLAAVLVYRNRSRCGRHRQDSFLRVRHLICPNAAEPRRSAPLIFFPVENRPKPKSKWRYVK